MRLTVHCLVKNEENFIWYAINSVINYVDEIMIWDMESLDKTKSIIQSIDNPKIKFKTISGEVVDARRKMLEETDAGWILLLDGDEVWWDDSIRDLGHRIENTKKDVLVSPNYMLIGDIYHYQEPRAGKYRISGRSGNFNIRAFRKTLGLQVAGVYPNEAFVTKEGIKLQNLDKDKISFLDKPYLHASFLPRSSKDKKKVKYEIGEEFPKDFYYPEVFFKDRPDFVPSPWKKMSTKHKLNAFWQTPLKKIKRRII